MEFEVEDEFQIQNLLWMKGEQGLLTPALVSSAPQGLQPPKWGLGQLPTCPMEVKTKLIGA